MWTATTRIQHRVPLLKRGQPEIGDANLVRPREQDILGLEIPMDDPDRVHVADASHDLAKIVRALVCVESPLFAQVVEQFSALDVLEKHVPAHQIMSKRRQRARSGEAMNAALTDGPDFRAHPKGGARLDGPTPSSPPPPHRHIVASYH